MTDIKKLKQKIEKARVGESLVIDVWGETALELIERIEELLHRVAVLEKQLGYADEVEYTDTVKNAAAITVEPVP